MYWRAVSMPARAVASALAAFLEEWDLHRARDLADFLDDFDSIHPGANARTLIAYIRSDFFESAVRATVAADAMEVAQASAELQLLGRELKRVRPFFRLRSSRSSCAAPVLVLHV